MLRMIPMHEHGLTEERILETMAEMEVPPHLRQGLCDFILTGMPPGHFLQSVLRNDLVGAFRRADGDSFLGMNKLLDWLLMEAPGPCWGSPEEYDSWINLGEKHRGKPADTLP